MVNRALAFALSALALLLAGVLLVGGAIPTAQAASVGSTKVVGSIHGPKLVAADSNSTYYINATGGPAYAANGTEVGGINWTAKVSGNDLTGVSLSPNASSIPKTGPGETHLKVGTVAETLVISVTISSTYGSSKGTTVLNYTVEVVRPYVVHAVLVAGPKAGILGFDVSVYLDGEKVGTVSVPALKANESYNLTYDYASSGLSPGEHTFSISLAGEHGLVHFAGGATQFSESFYVVGPAPDYPLYVLVGVVVFAGVLFIFMTRVAARRRPAARK